LKYMKNILRAELDELVRMSEKVRLVTEYEEVYFVNCDSEGFFQRASSIANRLESFKGVVVEKISAKNRLEVTFKLNSNKNFHFLEVADFLKLDSNKVILVDFKDSNHGTQFGDFASTFGFNTIDYLKSMNDLAMVHTYLPVNIEREKIIDHLDSFIKLIDSLADSSSKLTVLARVKALITSKREFLFNIACPPSIFTRDDESTSALYVTGKEHYVDVGAAHGDTVAQFYTASLGQYESITAFEPDSENYKSLNLLTESFPNTECHLAGLSDKSGTREFFETPENRFGSRFDKNSSKNLPSVSVNIFKMDDIIEHVSMLKIDVEGHESYVLEGGRSIISSQKPSMHISGYHFPEDLFKLVDLVRDIYPYKNIAIRHFSQNIYDTNILCSDMQRFS